MGTLILTSLLEDLVSKLSEIPFLKSPFKGRVMLRP